MSSALDPRRGGDLLEGDAVPLTMPAKARDERFLRGHVVSNRA